MPIKLSIGSAVYNIGEEHLRRHIESILHQLTDEVELLLIDDCSTDNSGEICREYDSANEHVRYVNMGTNGGLSRVRNRTIKEARGTWIFFADGDDIFSEYFVRNALSNCNEKYDMIIHDRKIFHNVMKEAETAPVGLGLIELPKTAGRDISVSCLCMRPLDGDRYGMSKNAYYHAAWGAIYRRDFLETNELRFPEGQKKAQDSVFNTYAYYYAESVAYLPYTMYYYRKDMQGITERYNKSFTETALSLISHHKACLDRLYHNDSDIYTKYERFRLISLSVDSMKLNFFHKNNPKPKDVRRREFLDFIDTEPFKHAINSYESDSAWWGWRIPISLAKNKRFAALDFLYKHQVLFMLYGKTDSVLRKIIKHR